MLRRAWSRVRPPQRCRSIVTWPKPFDSLDPQGYAVAAESVSILSTPSEFYEKLCDLSKLSQDRTSLCSLYVGDGSMERELGKNLFASSASVQIVLDAARARRGMPSSLDVLCDDVGFSEKIGDLKTVTTTALPHHVESLAVRLAGMNASIRRHSDGTPLPASRQLPAPARLLESMGVMHAKLYAFDDKLIMSGANLSTDYFTTRQDRYVLVDDAKLASAAHSQTAALANLQLLSKPSTPFPTPKHTTLLPKNNQVLIRCIPQCGPIGVDADWHATKELLQSLQRGDRAYIATGYFSLPKDLQDWVIEAVQQRGAQVHLLTASPRANGFLGAKGIAGKLPHAYARLLRRFAVRLDREGVLENDLSRPFNDGKDGRVSLYEWERPGWTFHAKGAWISRSNRPKNCVFGVSQVLVGSPNLGGRSFAHDLDIQCQIHLDRTQDEPSTSLIRLSNQFLRERDSIFRHAKRVNVSILSRREVKPHDQEPAHPLDFASDIFVEIAGSAIGSFL